MEQSDFIRRLVELRMNKGVSAREMSLSIGQAPSYINNIETGVNFPSMTAFFLYLWFPWRYPKWVFWYREHQSHKVAWIAGSYEGTQKWATGQLDFHCKKPKAVIFWMKGKALRLLKYERRRALFIFQSSFFRRNGHCSGFLLQVLSHCNPGSRKGTFRHWTEPVLPSSQ